MALYTTPWNDPKNVSISYHITSFQCTKDNNSCIVLVSKFARHHKQWLSAASFQCSEISENRNRMVYLAEKLQAFTINNSQCVKDPTAKMGFAFSMHLLLQQIYLKCVFEFVLNLECRKRFLKELESYIKPVCNSFFGNFLYVCKFAQNLLGDPKQLHELDHN